MLLSTFSPAQNRWLLTPGRYVVRVGGSSQTLPLQSEIAIP